MRSAFVLLAVVAMVAAAPVARAAACSSATVVASLSTDPGFEGLYKYCVEVRWDLDRYDVSHIDVFLAIPDCPCVCDKRLVSFGVPAGQSLNTSSGGSTCELDYFGEYACKGDPSLPPGINGPAVKFQPDPQSACAPGVSGHGTFCFYSPMPPQPDASYLNALAIKHGQEVCYGALDGQLPSCDCAVPAQAQTWGAVKDLYR
jgi:hypothetical protein